MKKFKDRHPHLEVAFSFSFHFNLADHCKFIKILSIFAKNHINLVQR